MSTRVSKSQFKPRALEWFRRIQETGQPVVITDRGEPVLEIVPYKRDPEALLRSLRGSVLRYERPTEPVAREEWEAAG